MYLVKVKIEEELYEIEVKESMKINYIIERYRKNGYFTPEKPIKAFTQDQREINTAYTIREVLKQYKLQQLVIELSENAKPKLSPLEDFILQVAAKKEKGELPTDLLPEETREAAKTICRRIDESAQAKKVIDSCQKQLNKYIDSMKKWELGVRQSIKKKRMDQKIRTFITEIEDLQVRLLKAEHSIVENQKKIQVLSMVKVEAPSAITTPGSENRKYPSTDEMNEILLKNKQLQGMNQQLSKKSQNSKSLLQTELLNNPDHKSIQQKIIGYIKQTENKQIKSLKCVLSLNKCLVPLRTIKEIVDGSSLERERVLLLIQTKNNVLAIYSHGINNPIKEEVPSSGFLYSAQHECKFDAIGKKTLIKFKQNFMTLCNIYLIAVNTQGKALISLERRESDVEGQKIKLMEAINEKNDEIVTFQFFKVILEGNKPSSKSSISKVHNPYAKIEETSQ